MMSINIISILYKVLLVTIPFIISVITFLLLLNVSILNYFEVYSILYEDLKNSRDEFKLLCYRKLTPILLHNSQSLSPVSLYFN